MNFPDSFFEYLNNHTLIEIKGGTNRDRFLEIWMVQVNGRVFARSWNKSKRSWFTAFLNEGIGQIKYGNTIINVGGKKLENEAETQQLIHQNYLEKYNQEGNIHFAKGITQPEYEEYTMEFFFIP